jgi:hypothetical protein
MYFAPTKPQAHDKNNHTNPAANRLELARRPGNLPPVRPHHEPQRSASGQVQRMRRVRMSFMR